MPGKVYNTKAIYKCMGVVLDIERPPRVRVCGCYGYSKQPKRVLILVKTRGPSKRNVAANPVPDYWLKLIKKIKPFTETG